ncbi:MAG: methylenetetrahydrofolate reductase [Acidimicrobiia bacterium]
MEIRQLFGLAPTLSFEFFPPKTAEAEMTFAATLQDLSTLTPSFVSVTYGAGGSTRERTHEIVVRLLETTPLLPMMHLTCAGHSRAELVGMLETYRAQGLANVLALRGDPPPELGLPPGDLSHARDLVALCREIGGFCVAVAAHPEGHPLCPDPDLDRERQAEKLRDADFAVTQFFFDVDVYTRFVDDMAARGVTTPIVPGIMPVTNLSQVARMAQLSGAAFPAWLEARLAQGGDDPEGVRAIGIEVATELCDALLRAGAPGLHLYTLNRASATRAIVSNLGLRVR